MWEYPMDEDILIGDGGNLAVYQRPDGSRYAPRPAGSRPRAVLGGGHPRPRPIRLTSPDRLRLARARSVIAVPAHA